MSFCFVIPAQAGIQSIEQFPLAGQGLGFVHYAVSLSCGIPACAGMTGNVIGQIYG